MITKLRHVFAITIAFLSFSGYAQTHFWKQDLSHGDIDQNFSRRFEVRKGKVFSFDEKMFKEELKKVSVAKGNSNVVYFPNEKGEGVAFLVKEAPVFSEGLSLRYPNIKSYVGKSLNESKDKIRFSVSHNGIQSMIVHSDKRGSTFMQKDSGNKYVVYSRDSDANRNADFLCNTKATVESKLETLFLKPIDGQVLRKFRLAVSTSGEYTEHHGGTVADALAAINATVTRINEVFETDLAVRLEVVPNTDQVIFTDPDNDPYFGSLSSKVQQELSNTIGEANYDIGILFNKAPKDGNAGSIGAVCVDGRKGSAYASTPNPQGDLFDLDFVAHEMGHQFGANHTWSFESEGSGVQTEPGSGTTIMGYAGIAGTDNVAQNGDDYFHYVSIVQVSEYLQTVSCGETVALANNPPVVTPTGSFTIPISTAFVLKGEATDTDVDDVLSYTWEQIDDGIVTQANFGPTNPIGANFKSQRPSASPERYFPNLSRILAGQLTQTIPQIGSAWETVSSVERELNFAFTVRDNAIDGGQVVADLVNVFVDNSAGPFIVTSQSTNVITIAGATEEVVWDVANTEQAPINAQTVDIFISVDGGDSFVTLLAEDVPNDGSHMVQIPAMPSTEARVMVKAHNNIFFAVNSSDFTINETEMVLNFDSLEQDVCAADILVVPFVYEAFLGFNEEVTFSVLSPPAGVDIVVFPETAMVTDTSVDIVFTNTENLAVGTYPIQVLATTATLTLEVAFNLNVYDNNFSDLTLISPMDGEIDTSTNLFMQWADNDLSTSYDIEIATDVDFTSIIETGSIISNRYTPTSLENDQAYYWRVRPQNSCDEGIFGAPFSFTTIAFSCLTKEAADFPKVISASGTPVVTSIVSVFDDLSVADINVNLELDHTFLSDLLVTLTSPAGTTVVLFGNSCDEEDNVNAVFDDEAISSFDCSGVPAINGFVKPQGSLSSFDGESTLGEWILRVSDNAPSDGGSLKAFSLEICAEGEFRPDADKDGVFDDGPDLCLGSPIGSQVDASGCPILIVSPSNYRIEAQSESCRSANDGAIVIDVQSSFDYTVSVTGNGVSDTSNFTAPSFTLNNLSAGVYSICISATDGSLISLEQCFNVVIEEPEVLSVSSQTSLDGSSIDLQLEGALLYNIELNGVVNQVEGTSITLNLKPGLNTLKITTKLPCQGIYQEQILFSKEPLAYPNPFENIVNVFFGNTVQKVTIRVFTDTGRFIQSSSHRVDANEIQLDLSHLATGLYFIQFEAENIKGTTKVMKR
jgi:subtilisin-like proprotein convertase family protein